MVGMETGASGGLALARGDWAGSGDVDGAPAVKYLQKIMLDAIHAGVSDIHFEPFEHRLRIRYRRDGVLHEADTAPPGLRDMLASRIKVISQLDIAEKRMPQDGRMKFTLTPGHTVDLRISTLPTLHGEKIVMRILDAQAATASIDELGYEPAQLQVLLEGIQRPHGMILATGPTGSGKTVSLYACLNILNRPGVNISTVEDPVEIRLDGINQVNINDKAGLDFATAMRAFLRQDPDILMVGEIRDTETAEIAIKAAQTGHLVLSTLHTNDAPATLTRLVNMGVPAYNVAASVSLITAQRLVRRLCPACRQAVDIPRGVLLDAGMTHDDLAKPWQAYAAVGCGACQGTGYQGRTGVFQVMPVSEAMGRIIMTGGGAPDISAQAAREGILTLRQAALMKLRHGITSLQEVLAQTNV